MLACVAFGEDDPRAQDWPAVAPGVAAAAGMAVLLTGAMITRRRAKDSGREMAPALLALAVTISCLAAALIS